MENQRKRALARTAIAVVLLHLLISVVHGAAHQNLHIEMNTWQGAYILLVITVMPLVAAVMLRRQSRPGFWLLFGSMLGSLLFGGYYHFIAPGADNVSSLGPHTWAPAFQITAALLAISEAAGVLVGVMGLRNLKS